MVAIYFSKSLLIKKDKVKIKYTPKTNEEYISVRYGCITFY